MAPAVKKHNSLPDSLAAWCPIVLLLLMLVGCQTRDEFASALPDHSDVPDQESWNATLTTTNDGVLAMRIQYTRMQKFSARRMVKFLDGVEIDLYNDQGERTTNVRSTTATLNEATRVIEFRGEVVVTAASGAVLHTDQLTWNEMKSEITSDLRVKIITAENDTLLGTDFRAEKSLRTWRLKKPRGTTQIEGLKK